MNLSKDGWERFEVERVIELKYDRSRLLPNMVDDPIKHLNPGHGPGRIADMQRVIDQQKSTIAGLRDALNTVLENKTPTLKKECTCPE